MRKLLMTLGISILFVTGVYAQNITLTINGENISTPVPPIQRAGTTLVPLRVVGDYLGAKIDWDDFMGE